MTGTLTDVDESRRFRSIAGRFATGVAVVTSCADGTPVGMTVNSFTTVSLDPRLLLVCLRRDCRLLGAVARSNCFAVTVLAADQQECAAWFANSARPNGAAEFEGIPAYRDAGCPVLSDGVAYFGCATERIVEAGDHLVLIGEVHSSGLLRDEPPLLFVDGHYAALAGDAS
jgi:3-hydroxy-9,10-secoandrosta-1,3,5(10)-triene-9,17-dione monooxygenase reductase component